MHPDQRNGAPPFLTAEWRHLAMLNFEIDPAALAPFVPSGTELDPWNGKTLISVVGFLFLQTRVAGFAIPFHRDFEEVNLRFYVRRNAEGKWRRGVVFIKEIVPRAAIAWVARTVYHEPYIAVPMRHRLQCDTGPATAAEYSWQFAGRENRIHLVARSRPEPLREGSEAEFITEHYWGFNRQPDGSTMEYQVDHPRWRVAEAAEARLECDVAGLYGPQFCHSLNGQPASAFLAEGSNVSVFKGELLST